ncbi:hypothetical protein [Cellulosilyticum ruminicola]|uniref:hypothetical protein n=1 Tax=Cellulosilyticum ruminicola TaxID=425254 RepID=UPI0006CFE378|nr:hypothetical protein [Cellulosilyticum ruminicola]
MPNLTTLVALYHKHKNEVVDTRIKEIFSHNIGILLVVEIMIDANHPVTMEHLKSSEISKNMKHVRDYYVILTSHLKKHVYNMCNPYLIDCLKVHLKIASSTPCLLTPVIVREKFPQFKNTNYNQTTFKNLF